MWRETVHSQSYATFFRHSAVLSLPAVLLRKLAICRLQTNSADKQYLSLRTHFKTVSFQLLKANRFKMGSQT